MTSRPLRFLLVVSAAGIVASEELIRPGNIYFAPPAHDLYYVGASYNLMQLDLPFVHNSSSEKSSWPKISEIDANVLEGFRNDPRSTEDKDAWTTPLHPYEEQLERQMIREIIFESGLSGNCDESDSNFYSICRQRFLLRSMSKAVFDGTVTFGDHLMPLVEGMMHVAHANKFTFARSFHVSTLILRLLENVVKPMNRQLLDIQHLATTKIQKYASALLRYRWGRKHPLFCLDGGIEHLEVIARRLDTMQADGPSGKMFDAESFSLEWFRKQVRASSSSIPASSYVKILDADTPSAIGFGGNLSDISFVRSVRAHVSVYGVA
jgi:hypothetical protein